MDILEYATEMVKNKEPSVRTYDEDGYKRRAGCLCFRDENEDKVLLVSSSSYPNRWVVPAGGIDPGEDAITAAQREVMEEACVKGNIGRFLGLFQNEKSRSRTYVFVMFVTEALNQVNCVNSEMKEKRWFDVTDAHTELIHKPVQQTYIEKAIQSKKAKTRQDKRNVNCRWTL